MSFFPTSPYRLAILCVYTRIKPFHNMYLLSFHDFYFIVSEKTLPVVQRSRKNVITSNSKIHNNIIMFYKIQFTARMFVPYYAYLFRVNSIRKV